MSRSATWWSPRRWLTCGRAVWSPNAWKRSILTRLLHQAFCIIAWLPSVWASQASQIDMLATLPDFQRIAHFASNLGTIITECCIVENVSIAHAQLNQQWNQDEAFLSSGYPSITGWCHLHGVRKAHQDPICEFLLSKWWVALLLGPQTSVQYSVGMGASRWGLVLPLGPQYECYLSYGSWRSNW